MVSEAVAPGAVQVPPDGQPIVLLPDCGTTGGYPRIAQVAAVDLPLLGQLRPGVQLRFREIGLAEAEELYLERCIALARFEAALLHWLGEE
jgi:antagonist of KipI